MAETVSNESSKKRDEHSFTLFIKVHEEQLKSSSVPERFWKSLFYKLQHSVFDAGDVFGMFQVESDESEEANSHDQSSPWKVLVTKEEGIQESNPDCIYLIDHAWTYMVNMARNHLRKIPYLLERMASLMDIPVNEHPQESIIEEVFNKMWKFNQTYHLGNPEMEVEEKLPIWYIMDEFGSRIQHSDNPTFRTVPFFYSSSQITYTLLFPVKDLNYHDEVTRDYVEGLPKDELTRKALKIPWFPCMMTEISFEQKERDRSFLKSSVQMQETLPSESSMSFDLPNQRPLKVFSEYLPLIKSLNHPAFQLVEDEKDADILWYTHHYKDYK